MLELTLPVAAAHFMPRKAVLNLRSSFVQKVEGNFLNCISDVLSISNPLL
ncbi:hypothetical protein SynRS9915_02671 [Synechococcus sp. RS9915]|nr:hypothetical protein SynRS9915_02671 [Synechococcus sp. RS9915]